MKKRTLKAIGFLMTLVMLFGLVTAYPTMSAEEPVLDAEQLLPDAVQEVTVPAEPSLPTKIPTELISDSTIAEAGHVRRLPQAEGDMNTVMLANEDGTHSMYLFSYPVKYTDENGNVYDKSNRLTAHSRSGYAYVNEENDIQTHLPTDITKNPVMLTYGDYAVATYIGTESLRSTAQLQNENTVLYTGAFGADTAVRYTADFSGYKEDVILYSSSAPTSFIFLLRPAGLVPVAENGVIRYQDKDTGETVLTTSPFYIYDSAENPNSYIDTDFSLEELTGGIYVLTVTLDAEYLATEGLTYPIYVDPTLSYMSSDAVETTAVYSGSTMLNQACGNELYHYVGYREMPYSQGRMLVRLNALKDNVLFRSLSADQVTSVTLNLMSAGGGGSSSTVIMAYQFTGADSWTPTGAKFSDVQASSYALPYCGTTMAPDDSVCSLNVTSIAQGWVGFEPSATTKASQGIILLNSNSVYPEFSRRFYGSQSFTGVLPTVTVTYTPEIEDGTYYIKNYGTDGYLQIPNNTQEENIITGDFDNIYAKWIITLQSNGYYTVKSATSTTTQNVYIGISNSDITGSGEVIQTSTIGRGAQWAIVPTGRGTYVLMANPVASNANGALTQVLSLPPANESDGVVEQHEYSDDFEFQDEWFFQRILPTNGYEITYSPSSWSGYVQNCCNCYAYALNNQVYPGTNLLWFMQQMGFYKGADYQYSALTETNIYTAVINDYNAYNEEFGKALTFQRIGRYDICPAGTYKVALVASNNDYHWYRQDADGLWSHKRGLNPVERTDYSGNLIIDPYIADRGEYTEFLGYYAVTPWSESFIADGIVYCYFYEYVISYTDLMNYLFSRQSSQYSISSYTWDKADIDSIIANTSAITYEKAKEVLK